MKKSMLLSTIAMIVVVVVALSTATFAWFSAQQQSAITGTMTVTAQDGYRILVANSGKTAWQDAGDTIDIANGMTGISPASPNLALTDSKILSVDTATGTTAMVPTVGTDYWYTAVGKSGAYTTLTKAATTGFAITPFQIYPADGTAQTATVTTTIKVANDGANLAALKGVRVVYRVDSYDDTGAYAETEWFGTTYKYGGNGFVGGDGSLLTSDEAWKTATGAGTDITGAGYVSITNSSANTYSALETDSKYTTLETALAGGKDVFIVDATPDDDDGIYRIFTKELTFNSATRKTITIFVWLDGHAVDEAAGGKTINLSVGIEKKV